jgi:hypothetical protein
VWHSPGVPAATAHSRHGGPRNGPSDPLTYRHRASFEALDGWLEESRKYGADNMAIIVAATKADQPVRKVLAAV